MRENKVSNNVLILSIVLIIIAAASRLLPHPSNFTAIGAMALFAGVSLRNKKLAYLLPFFALFLTDLILGLHFSILPVYACFAFTVWLGTRLEKSPKPMSIGLLSLLSSVVFFLVTNLPFWYADLSLYPLNFQGTIQSYTLTIPFFKNQIVGDLFYNTLIFGTYHLVSKREKISIA